MIPAIAVGLGLAAHMFGASSLVAKEVIRAGDTVTAANISMETIPLLAGKRGARFMSDRNCRWMILARRALFGATSW